MEEEWLVPANIPPLRLLAYKAIHSWTVRDELNKGNDVVIQAKAAFDRLGETCVSFSKVKMSYVLDEEDKIGPFVMSRKRQRCEGVTAQGPYAMHDLVRRVMTRE